MLADKKYLIGLVVVVLVVILLMSRKDKFTPLNPQKDVLFTSGSSMRLLGQEPTDSSMGEPNTVRNAQWPENKGIDPLKYIQI